MSGTDVHPGPLVPGASGGAAPDPELAAALEAELDAAVALRHAVHRDPRVSGDEAATRDAVLAALADLPEAVEFVPAADTGALLALGPGDGPARVAVRAELDALPVIERTGLPFAASGHAAHVCGHDVHLAALVALVRAVARVGAHRLPAPLLAVFQPREESAPSGAADIAADPAFAARRPGAVLAVHVQPELPRGVVSVREGAVNASSDEVEIVVTGRGGHGGYPHRTADPVLALAACVVSAQHVVSRRTDPLRAGVITVGQLRAGSAPNVVPESATARGTVRALDADRDALLAALREVVEHTAAAHGCRGEVTVVPNEPAVVNDATLARAVAASLGARRPDGPRGPGAGVGDVAGPGGTVDTAFRSCGADDFAHYGATLPSLMLFVGTTEPGAVPGTGPGLHHPEFSPDDAILGEVARAMLAAVVATGDVLRAAGPPTPTTGPPHREEP